MSFPNVDTSINTLNTDSVKQKFAEIKKKKPVTHLKYFMVCSSKYEVNSAIYLVFFLLLSQRLYSLNSIQITILLSIKVYGGQGVTPLTSCRNYISSVPSARLLQAS